MCRSSGWLDPHRASACFSEHTASLLAPMMVCGARAGAGQGGRGALLVLGALGWRGACVAAERRSRARRA